ncbi:acyl-CoA-binding domain-containing protein 4-like isoform X2 [Mercurialis annua]|uniref:acyl-CoA-binding domain-containing protein 4-like isoform X2 n=1 Tax=Mercurialis annua TaxID=3986 RepID=UPI002160E8FE|nr:acyl-CoA-binding domain-containing protein 4-like isoform X2 [Mercurialis annua]
MGSLGDYEVSKKKAMWLYPKVAGFLPSERWGHSACYSHGLVYVYGGCCGGLHFNDVLKLNLDTMSWTTLATTGQGPGPRDSHSAVIVGSQMFVFGGTNGSKKVNDLHVLDLVTREWIRPEFNGIPPCPRESHTATLIGHDKILIFGGSGEGEANYLNDLHLLDLKTMRWSSPEVTGDIPVPRDSHSAVAIGNELFVYGGDRGDRYHGDVDVLDTDRMTWRKLVVQGSSPGVRAGHAAVNIQNKVYVIGGVGDKHYYNDVWFLDVVSCSWTQLDICGHQPQGRFSHTAVVADSDIAIYGGCGEDERPLNELLILQLGAEHPNGRYNVSMCKIFGKHCNQEKRTSLRAENDSRTILLGNGDVLVRKEAHEPELNSKHALRLSSETPYPKRKRTMKSNSWEVESEQEEHSLSLSQHSSPSQSDQEQTPVGKAATDSVSASQGFNLFKQLNQIPRNCQPVDIASYQHEARNTHHGSPYNLQVPREYKKPEQCVHVLHTGRQGIPFTAIEEKAKDAVLVQNLMGAEVRGRVDGAFDSGLLMTATVNGKIFRGVLFAPVPEFASRGAILAQNASTASNHSGNLKTFPTSNHMEPLKSCQQPSAFVTSESGHGLRQTQMNRRPLYPFVRATPSLTKEAKMRNDLQGVVLTLGGPGGGQR